MIFDCFTFCNELDLLELRLETLSDVVDKFVLVEADQTFTGKSKPFFFAENKARFTNYLDRIIHVQVGDMPQTNNPWDREHFQRNAVVRGLSGSQTDDIVLLSDIDEIPHPDTLLRLTSDGRCLSLLETYPLVLIQNIYYYYVNVLDREQWPGSIAIRKKNFAMSPEELRTLRFRLPRLRNGGWHFSYMGGAEQVRQKLNSIVALDENTPENNDIEQLKVKISQNVNILKHRGEIKFSVVKVDESYPAPIFAWLRRHPEYLKQGIEEAAGWVPPSSGKYLSHVVQWRWFLRRLWFNRKMNWD